MRIGLIMQDCGDGSNTIRYFKDIELAYRVINDDNNCDEFGMCESVEELDVFDDCQPFGGFSDEHWIAHYAGEDED